MGKAGRIQPRDQAGGGWSVGADTRERFPGRMPYTGSFFYWLPNRWRKYLLRHFTLWGWLEKPSPEEVERFLSTTRLLDLSEMRRLFPDCTILREKFGGFTKSYIAVRVPPRVKPRQVLGRRPAIALEIAAGSSA